jgi:nucleoid DNA-binding protein
MRINETDVQAVITHQFKGVLSALKDNNSVEISGFGKLLLNKYRATRMATSMKKQVEDHLTEGKPLPMKRSLETVQEEIALIEKRLYGDKTNTDH